MSRDPAPCLVMIDEGRPRLPESVHPMADLLELAPEQVLDAFRLTQEADFAALVQDVERPGHPLYDLFAELKAQAGEGNPFHDIALFRPGVLGALFAGLHTHVMDHPVWRHPLFLRVFEGRFTKPQLIRFAQLYFNQVKNTRQCVALSVGRFHGMMGLPYGGLNERVSELTQVVLAQLVADEYGVGSHEIEDYPSLDSLFRSRTHIAMYRQLFDGLGVAFADQDVPPPRGVADNVLIQRMVAGDPRFTPLESLASVGLGMEWGVPEFFSLLLGGMIRWALREDEKLTPHHLEVFIAHVRYDVLHAVSVMLVTSLHMRSNDDVAAVKGSVNALMAGRYGMMTDLYAQVFGETCPSLAEIGLESRHKLTDPRYGDGLTAARRATAPGSVEGWEDWLDSPMPLVFV